MIGACLVLGGEAVGEIRAPHESFLTGVADWEEVHGMPRQGQTPGISFAT